MTKKQFLLVDGMALLFRGYFSTAFRNYYMKTKEGIPTNGMYQFSRYLFDAIHHFRPTHVICCWDMGSKTFRNDIYPDYKANREEPPAELVPQFDLVKELTESLSIPNIGLTHYEADDCIGTLATQLGEYQITILTGDQDILQLVDDHTQVAIMRKGIGNYEVFNSENFYQKKGILPKQIVDLKGLMGDSADNYPGVKGIGEKTALKLLKEYGSVENILASFDQLTKGLQKKITTDLKLLHLSRDLAEIKRDVPVSCDPDEAIWNVDIKKAEKKFAQFEMEKLLEFLDADQPLTK
jgi:5'-3' exonuclease